MVGRVGFERFERYQKKSLSHNSTRQAVRKVLLISISNISYKRCLAVLGYRHILIYGSLQRPNLSSFRPNISGKQLQIKKNFHNERIRII